ncbi:MAG: translation initiation factor IF-2 N-terminal domain-containing protein, partial [Armatimonadota bacterium]|nr:translation initiation factor IF-2 N-terminal domain-containing protein [Armatimonadota bacterium]
MRVYELAKELGISNRELIAALADLGVEVKSHSSTIDEQSADLVIAKLKKQQKASEEQKEVEKKEKPKEAEQKAELEQKAEPAQKPEKKEKPETPRGKIELPPQATVRQLAELLKVQTAEIQKALVKQGALVAVNQIVPPDLAKKVVESLGFTVVVPPPKPPKKEQLPPAKTSTPKAEVSP